MQRGRTVEALILTLALLAPGTMWAAHPLVTDDTGTQGKGKFQIEVNGQWARDKESKDGSSVEMTGSETAFTVAAGIADQVDVIASLPYVYYRADVDGVKTAEEQGIGDVTVEAKWRFFEQGGLSFALKPGMTFPTGDEDKGLGTGKPGYHLLLVATKEFDPITIHANLGYIRNDNDFEEEEDLWHVSVAAEYAIAQATRLVGNIGKESNTDPSADEDPAFGVIGVIHSPQENLDLDAGIRFGLNNAEDDLAVLAGVTVRF
jgi:hypothetical protein